MDQIVSVCGYGNKELHSNGLMLTAKTKSYHVTVDIGDIYCYAGENPSPVPQLLIIDHAALHDVVNHITSKDFGESWRKIPVVEIFDYDHIRENERWAPHLNVVHCMTIEEQYTPNNFRRIVRALDIAQGKGPVTLESFQEALALVSGRNTALDKARGSQAMGLET